MSKISKYAYDQKLVFKIQSIIESHIKYLMNTNFNNKQIKNIVLSLKLILNENYNIYRFDDNLLSNIINDSLSDIEFQDALSKLNEKQDVRKINGVYYTPKDVVSFMVENCFYKRLGYKDGIVSDFVFDDFDVRSIVYRDSVFDPTCGTGEFLLGALIKKIELMTMEKSGVSDGKLIDILSTIYGNDIDACSIDITKLRLFFEVVKYTNDENSYQIFAEVLNRNMTCQDFVNIKENDFQKFDMIIGNPPYVETGRYPIKTDVSYGNIYANVLHNSVNILTTGGVMGFIIPISYISTPRMKNIRRYIRDNSSSQFILNYADRPDCLFTSVHQKLSILFTVQGNEKHKLYTTGYKYWYRKERVTLFKDTSFIDNEYIYDNFYPKLGNAIEKKIFCKVFTEKDDSIFSHSMNCKHNIYINMRACFWIKAFSFNPGSKEYKGFHYSDDIKSFILCLLNSSLFFLYWNTVSDCWHITSKELKHFKIPNTISELSEFNKLALELEERLEKTKKDINTKQTKYEYKHKLCKDIIDRIDDKLAKSYKLTKSELEYIKSYSTKYREGLGN